MQGPLSNIYQNITFEGFVLLDHQGASQVPGRTQRCGWVCAGKKPIVSTLHHVGEKKNMSISGGKVPLRTKITPREREGWNVLLVAPFKL